MSYKNLIIKGIIFGVIFTTTHFAIRSCASQPASSESSTETSVPTSTAELIRHWKEHYKDEVLHSYTFTQETVRYRDGVAQEPAIWEEAVQYPSYFRIDLPKTAEGHNINLSRNDSVYVFRKGVMVDSSRQIQQFMIMEGSMYFDPVDSTLAKLREVGIDPDIFTTSQYQNRTVYIIGAQDDDLSVPQIWVDAERRYNVRRFSKTRSDKLLEVRYSEFKPYDGYWMEHWLEFLIDGKIVQTERYKHINIHPQLTSGTFDRDGFFDHFWY